MKEFYKKYLAEAYDPEDKIDTTQTLVNSADPVTIKQILSKFSDPKNKEILENLPIKFSFNRGEFIEAKGASLVRTVDGEVFIVFHE